MELEDDHGRYDFQYDWSESNEAYMLSTLYDRGVDSWVSDSGDGDAAFRDAFMTYLQDENGIEIEHLTIERASTLASSMNDELDHRFSFSFKGGDLDGKNSVEIGTPPTSEMVS